MTDPKEVEAVLAANRKAAEAGRAERERMTALAERMESAGIPVRGWWWTEQGGPFCVAPGERVPVGQEGEWAVPLVSALDVADRVTEWTEYGKTWNEALEDGTLRPGVEVMVDGCVLLVGDVNKLGGTCDCCPEVRGLDVIERYRVRIEPDPEA